MNRRKGSDNDQIFVNCKISNINLIASSEYNLLEDDAPSNRVTLDFQYG